MSKQAYLKKRLCCACIMYAKNILHICMIMYNQNSVKLMTQFQCLLYNKDPI